MQRLCQGTLKTERDTTAKDALKGMNFKMQLFWTDFFPWKLSDS